MTIAHRYTQRERQSHRQSNCNETGYFILCVVSTCGTKGQRGVFLVRSFFRVCGADSMRGPSRPRLRSNGTLSGGSARRQQNVVALFLQHIARLWMQCAEESARTNGLGAWRYAAQASQAERFWHGRIIAYTGVGCIACDAPSIMANALCTISYGFHGTDALQPRGLVVQAHIGTHASVIVWCQCCLGPLSALMSAQCYVHGRTAPCMHGYC